MGSASLGGKERRGPYLLLTHLKLPAPGCGPARVVAQPQPLEEQGAGRAKWGSAGEARLPPGRAPAPRAGACTQPARRPSNCSGCGPPELCAPRTGLREDSGNISAGLCSQASRLARREEDTLKGLLVTAIVPHQLVPHFQLCSGFNSAGFLCPEPIVCHEADIWTVTLDTAQSQGQSSWNKASYNT